MQEQFTNQEAREKILDLREVRTVKALKVPTKETNFYHKKVKAIERMYEPIKYSLSHAVCKK